MSYEESGSPVGKIFPSLSAVKRAIAKVGVEKTGLNKKQDYNYRGIDNVMDVFATPLAENDVMTLPVYSNLEREQIKTSNGNVMWLVRIELTLTFLSLLDSSSITVGPFVGEASDTMDKAVSKAHSVAYRNAMLLTFTCPLGPEMDPEASELDREIAGDNTMGGDTAAVDELSAPAQEPLSESQRGQLTKRLEAVGVTAVDFRSQFGVIHAGNYRDAMQAAKTAKPSKTDEPQQ